MFEAQTAEMESKRFAARLRTNIFVNITKTDYSTRILLPKWSEKVAALDLLIECGGETPYKLELPSPSVNYAPIIAEMRKLLNHSHFAVASKAMQALSMLAQGVGEKLYGNLRPFVSVLLQLGKDKKLTKAAASCLDSLFGSVLSFEHLLDKDDSVTSQLDEKHQKNAVVRSSGLEYLERCIKKSEGAGKRGQLNSQCVRDLSVLGCEKLSDTDAKVRQAALTLLQTLLELKDPAFSHVVKPTIEGLKSSNARAYKTLSAGASTSGRPKIVEQSPAELLSHGQKSVASIAVPSPQHRPPTSGGKTPDEGRTPSSDFPDYEDSLGYLKSLSIPSFGASEDNGGILAGLKSSKWLNRHSAIQALNSYCRRHEMFPGEKLSSAVLIVTKLHTKGFKDSNFNILKSSLDLFLSLCELHSKSVIGFPVWACKDGVALATDKLADKKLSSIATALLTEMCVVNVPCLVIDESFESIDRIKSPLIHEAYLKWFNKAIIDFGGQTLGLNIGNVVSFLNKECSSTNIKVRNASLSVAGELHRQFGPAFRALALSKATESSIKSQLEALVVANPFDPAENKKVRSKKCVLANGAGGSEQSDSESMLLEVPRLDLVGEIGEDCIVKLGSKDGKTAWKLRKEALDEIADALKNCNGMLATNNVEISSLLELLRALKARLSDSQSNLKPVAARIIGTILGAVDKISQGKLGKVVLPSLVNSAMNDSRKPMRDESLEAIKVGTRSNDLDGGDYHELSLEALVIALVGELKESDFKTAGIPDVLLFVASVADHLPNMDSILMTRAQPLGEAFSQVLINALTSSKSEIRAAAESLMKACIDAGKINAKTARKGLEHLKPAQQRSVAPIVQKIIGELNAKSPRNEKENVASKRSKSTDLRSVKPNDDDVGLKPPPQGSLRSAPLVRVSHKESTRHETVPAKMSTTTNHPLLVAHGNSGYPRGRRLGGKQISWVEFPEEPVGGTLLNTLQSAWSQLIPKDALSALFPNIGIKKQDDAKDGCELIAQAIEFESKNGGDLIVQQLELLLKWSAFTLCSRGKYSWFTCLALDAF